MNQPPDTPPGESALDPGSILGLLARNAPLAVWAVSPEGDLLFLEGRIGEPPRPVERREVLETIRTEPLASAFPQALAGRRVCLEAPLAGRTHQVHLVPATGAAGEVRAVLGLAVDVEARQAPLRELRESLATVRALLNGTSDGAMLMTTDWTILALNEAAASRLGRPVEELIGRKIDEFRPPAEVARRKAFISEAARIGRPFRFQDFHQGRTFEVTVQPVLDQAGQTISQAVFSRDVTDQLRADKALRLSEARYRAIVEDQTEMICRFLPEGTLTFVNQAYARDFGLRVEDLIGQSFLPFLPPPDQERVLKHLRSLDRSRPIGVIEHPVRLGTGEVRWRRWTDRAIFDAQGRFVEFQGVGQDITDRVRAEEALRDSERRLSALLNNLPGLAFRCAHDPRRTIEYLSGGCRDLTGYDREELLGHGDFMSLVDPRDRGQVRREIEEAVRNGRPYSLEYRIITKSGQEKWVWEKATPVREREVVSHSLEGFITDVTDKKLLEQRLLQAQKLESLGQMAAGIAHEINSPAQCVGTNVFFLGDAFKALIQVADLGQGLGRAALAGEPLVDLAQDLAGRAENLKVPFLLEETPRAIQAALEALDRISGIVQSMRYFAHPGRAEKKPLDLNEVVSRTVRLAENQWRPVAEVETDLAPDIPLAPANPAEIHRALLNVFVNAVQAVAEAAGDGSGAKGRIRLSTRQDGRAVEVRISDTGPGIDPSIQSRIFDPFFTTKEVGQGTGQGLALALAVMRKHGGSITFETERGRGTTFILRLPLDPA